MKTKEEVLQAFNSYQAASDSLIFSEQVRNDITEKHEKELNKLNEEIEILRIKASYVDDLKQMIKFYKNS